MSNLRKSQLWCRQGLRRTTTRLLRFSGQFVRWGLQRAYKCGIGQCHKQPSWPLYQYKEKRTCRDLSNDFKMISVCQPQVQRWKRATVGGKFVRWGLLIRCPEWSSWFYLFSSLEWFSLVKMSTPL